MRQQKLTHSTAVRLPRQPSFPVHNMPQRNTAVGASQGDDLGRDEDERCGGGAVVAADGPEAAALLGQQAVFALAPTDNAAASMQRHNRGGIVRSARAARHRNIGGKYVRVATVMQKEQTALQQKENDV